MFAVTSTLMSYKMLLDSFLYNDISKAHFWNQKFKKKNLSKFTKWQHEERIF